MTELCSNCGDLCCGDLRIKVFRDRIYPFCNNCFNVFQYLRMSLLKQILKHNDNVIT